MWSLKGKRPLKMVFEKSLLRCDLCHGQPLATAVRRII